MNESCKPECKDLHPHVYILCYGKPTIVADRDRLAFDPTIDYPISHYVGVTRQRPPLKRVNQHKADSANHIALIKPGDEYDEDFAKLWEKCPKCRRDLWYYAESPTYNDDWRTHAETRHFARYADLFKDVGEV
jgi:hypothetical protein